LRGVGALATPEKPREEASERERIEIE
jgi:hypothetical protein